MGEVGFVEDGRHFRHPGSKHLVEFPPGPLAVGFEPVKSTQEIRLPTGALWIISPADGVKDRHAHYFHWQDRQALEQAILVAKNHRVDLRELARWARAEGVADKYRKIRSRIPRPPGR